MADFGVDISRYNGNIDFKKAKASGVKFVIIRAVSGASGVYLDPKAETYYQGAKNAGLGVGVYIAGYNYNLDREIAVTESFLKGKQFDYPIYYDVESFNGTTNFKTKAQTVNATDKFLSYFEKKGYYVGIYANKSWFNTMLNDSRLNKYDKWIAHWVNGSYEGTQYSMWQFTNRKKVNGMPNTSEGGVDGNYCYVDYPAIIKKAGLNGYKKETKEVKKVDNSLTKEQKDAVKNTVVTYLDGEYDRAYKIAKAHKALMAPASFLLDYSRMNKSGDTIIAVGGDKLGKIDSLGYGLTGYSNYHVKANDSVDEFLKDRKKFIVKKKL
ncbi:MAG: GH25 family lysozyme [Finegoldia sp.]|nr:GH25 family lysozyme [Finegoldia sp.]